MAVDARGEPNKEDLHRFGSVHTILKLETLAKYLPAYTQALKNTRFRLHYVDAFAGSGVCHVKVGIGSRLMVPGSASIAIDCAPPFHHMVFIEKTPRRALALQRLKQRAPERNITIVQGDANAALPLYVRRLNANDRALVFLDPYGMQLEWGVLRELAASRITDLWYLFPLSALYRQAAKDATAIDEDKSAALTRMLGTDEWRTAFYERKRQANLFGETPDVRHAQVPEILSWVKKRLETIFPYVEEPKLLHQVFDSGKQGAPLFALFFAMSNPSPPAIGLAKKIVRSILKL
jgi:three-Cys-motif partner protein